jgi:hypothetical protein
MVEKKSNSLVVIIILGVVAIALSVVIWNMGSKLSEISEENRKLIKQVSELTSKAQDDNTCTLEKLNGAILSFPKQMDSSVVVDSQTEGKYKYNGYTIQSIRSSNDTAVEKTILIFDKNNKQVYEHKHVKVSLQDGGCEHEKDFETEPVISNGKLYFVAIINQCYDYDENSKFPYYEYISIDLNNSSIKENRLQLLKLMMEGEASDDLDCIR